MEAILVYIVMSLAISVIAILDDLKSKGYKFNPVDGDKDGLIQDGTRWQRSAKKRG